MTSSQVTAGSRVGKYRLERLLGRGGMGEVWASHDPDLDRRVAIKMLRGAIASSPDALARLQREGRAMARLRHPNVIAVHDATFDGGRGVIAMELIDGENLASWLMREHPLGEIVQSVLAAGRGLAAAHAAEMIHRDFKPHNVLVERGGRVVVTDFGLARAIELAPPVVHVERPPADGPQTVVSVAGDVGSAATEAPAGDVGSAATETPPAGGGSRPSAAARASGSLDSPLTEEGTLLGTPAYMAPEQLAGQTADARADQFAFCITAWEAITGGRPFVATTAVELVSSMRRGELLRVRTVPRRWRTILARGLAFDPADRWPSMDVLLRRLERAWNRPRRIAIVAIVAVVVAGAGVALVATRGSREEPCVDPDDALVNVWSPAIRAEIDRKLVGQSMHDGALELFDRWRSDWRDLSDQACHERHTPAATALGSCLASVRDEAALVMAVRSRLSAKAFEPHTLEAILSRPEICRHNPRLALPPPPVTNRAALEDVRVELIDGWINMLASEPPRDVIGMVSRARALDYRPFIAEALILSSSAPLIGCGPLDEAAEIAEAIGHDRIHEHAMVGQLGCALRRHDNSWITEKLARQAGATAERTGDPVDGTIIEVQRARLASWAQRWTEAIDRTVKAKAMAAARDVPALGSSIAEIEAVARIGRHLGDDLDRADALIRELKSTTDGDVVVLRLQLAWLHGRPLDDVLLPTKDRAASWIDLAVQVRDGGVPVAGASVEAGAPSADRGARVLARLGRRPAAATTNAAGVATLAIPPTAYVIARSGGKQAVAPIAGAHAIALDLQPSATVDIEISRIGPASATDPVGDDARAARRSLFVVGLVGETGAWFAATVDDHGHAHASLPPGRYVVAAYARSGLADLYSVQQAITAEPGATSRVALAVDPAPRTLTVIAKPSRDSVIVAFTASTPPDTAEALTSALRSATSVSTVELGQLPRPPEQLGAEARDGYAQLTRPGAGPFVVCEVTDRAFPSGAPPVALVTTKPPRCRVVTATETKLDLR